MEYVLQYFDEFVNEYNMLSEDRHTFICEKILLEVDKEELLDESKKVIRELRKVYLSQTSKSIVDEYVIRVLKQILRLKVNIEEIIRNLEVELIEFAYPKSNLGILANYNMLYRGVFFIMNEIVSWEVDFKNVIPEESLKYSINNSSSEYILGCHKLFRNYVCNGIEMPMDIIEKHGIVLSAREYYECKYYFNDLEKNHKLSEYLFSITEARLDYKLKDYYLDFCSKYILDKEDNERKYYKNIRVYLIKSTFEFKDESEKMDYIVNFFIYNNLCHEYVIDFFKSEVYHKYSENNDNLVDYVERQRVRLKNIACSKEIRYFNSILIGKKTKTSLIKKLDQFFLVLIQDLQLPDYSKEFANDETINNHIEPIIFNHSGECLGILISLMYEVGLFNDQLDDTVRGEALARFIKCTSKGKNQNVKPRTIYGAFNINNRENNEKNKGVLIKKLNHMVTLLVKMD